MVCKNLHHLPLPQKTVSKNNCGKKIDQIVFTWKTVVKRLCAGHLNTFRHCQTLSLLLQMVITSVKEAMFSLVFVGLFVCLFVSNFAQNCQTDLDEIFREGWQWAHEQLIKCWWRSGSPSVYRDCFPDSIPLRDRESWTALQL